MENTPSPLADAFAALAAELRARAQAGTGQGADAVWHALILLGLARVLWVLEAMVRHGRATRTAPAAHHLLAAAYPRAAVRRPLTARLRADWRSFRRPPRVPAAPLLPSRAHPAPRRHPQPGLRPRAHLRLVPSRAARPVPHPPAFSKRAFPAAPRRALYVP